MFFARMLSFLMGLASILFFIVLFSIPWNPDFPIPVFASLFLSVLLSLISSLLCWRRSRNLIGMQLFMAILGYVFVTIALVVPLEHPHFIVFYSVIAIILFMISMVIGVIGGKSV